MDQRFQNYSLLIFLGCRHWNPWIVFTSPFKLVLIMREKRVAFIFHLGLSLFERCYDLISPLFL